MLDVLMSAAIVAATQPQATDSQKWACDTMAANLGGKVKTYDPCTISVNGKIVVSQAEPRPMKDGKPYPITECHEENINGTQVLICKITGVAVFVPSCNPQPVYTIPGGSRYAA